LQPCFNKYVLIFISKFDPNRVTKKSHQAIGPPYTLRPAAAVGVLAAAVRVQPPTLKGLPFNMKKNYEKNQALFTIEEKSIYVNI